MEERGQFMSRSSDKTQKEKELAAFRKRRQIGRRQKRKRKFKKIMRVTFRVTLFLTLVGVVSIAGYKGLSGALDEYKTKVEVSNQKIFEIEEVQLVLNENGTSLKFYIEQHGEEDKMVATERKVDNIRFRSRKDYPVPYLRVVCDNEKEVCHIDEAKEIILFINKEDITGLQVN